MPNEPQSVDEMIDELYELGTKMLGEFEDDDEYQKHRRKWSDLFHKILECMENENQSEKEPLKVEFWAAVRRNRNGEEWLHLETATVISADEASELQMEWDQDFPDVAVNNECVRIARFRAVEVEDED